jgi:hypothetical protein
LVPAGWGGLWGVGGLFVESIIVPRRVAELLIFRVPGVIHVVKTQAHAWACPP